MKKILFTALLLGGLSAQAQQLTNADFDGNWSDCTPWDSEGQTKTGGTQPDGWTISNVSSTAMVVGHTITTIASKETRDNGFYVKLQNKEMLKNYIPAYISLGTTWATAQIKATSPVEGTTDGGTWGGISFKYRPDAISFDYIRDNSNGTENATVVAYLWKGTYKQAEVPANTTNKTIVKVTMTNRDRNILGISTSLGGSVSTEGDAKLIASKIHSIPNSTNGAWVNATIELDYKDKETVPEMFNIIFSANDYFADRSTIVKNNSLSVDNVKLIYYSTLSTLTYDGTNLLVKATTSADGKTVSIDMSNTLYQTGKLAKTLKGVGASVLSEGYDAATGLYTIKVAGNDNNNGSNVTTYNIQFMKQVTIEAGKDIQTTAGKAQVKMIRDFKQGWNTVCLPFLTEVSTLGASKAQEFTTGDDQSVTFTEVSDGKLKANTPYLVYFAEAKSFTSSNPFTAFVDLYASQSTDVTFGAFTFHGNYTNGMSMNGLYGVANVNGKQRLCKGGAGATLPAGCAYFTTTSQKANSFAINFDGQSTGIADATIDNGETRAAVYNLQGIKVSTNGTTSLPAGIYIQGGRKVIVK